MIDHVASVRQNIFQFESKTLIVLFVTFILLILLFDTEIEILNEINYAFLCNILLFVFRANESNMFSI